MYMLNNILLRRVRARNRIVFILHFFIKHFRVSEPEIASFLFNWEKIVKFK